MVRQRCPTAMARRAAVRVSPSGCLSTWTSSSRRRTNMETSYRERWTGASGSSMGNAARVTAVTPRPPPVSRRDRRRDDDDGDNGRGRRSDKGGWRSRVFRSLSRAPISGRERDRSASRHGLREDNSSSARRHRRPAAAPPPRCA
jgi:hypothetical protein